MSILIYNLAFTWLNGVRILLVMGTELLGGRIKRLREHQGWSLRALARRADVSAGQISALENNLRKAPSADKLAGIAKALDMTLDDLLHGTVVGVPSSPGQEEPDDEVLLAQAEIGKLLADAREDFPNKRDYQEFRRSVIETARRFWHLSRRMKEGCDGNGDSA